VLRFGFFVTPVIFALPAAGTARFLMMLNPVTPVVVSGRAWVTGSGEALPSLLALVTLGSLLLGGLGLLTYKVALPYVVERLGG
jgi:lipopolysaccharide transport system permease protein